MPFLRMFVVPLAWMALVALGCVPPAVKLRASLAKDAGSAFGCAETEIDVAMGGPFHRAGGCGQSDFYVHTSVRDGRGGFEDKWISLKKEAEYELSCKPAEMTLTDLGGATVGVAGCGRKAVYLARVGAWSLQSDTRPEQE